MRKINFKGVMITRDDKDARLHKALQTVARRAGYDAMEQAHTETWSSRMPAYCYTELCAAEELRERTKRC